jgi:hypothetical protein
MGRILNLKPWSSPPTICGPGRPLRPGVTEAIGRLLEGKPSPAEVADAALQSIGVMQDKAVLGSRNGVVQPKFGFVLKNARPIVPEGTVDRPYGRFPVAAFPLSDVADPWLANRRTAVTHKKRFTEGPKDAEPYAVDRLHVDMSLRERMHPDLFNRYMAKLRKVRDYEDNPHQSERNTG